MTHLSGRRIIKISSLAMVALVLAVIGPWAVASYFRWQGDRAIQHGNLEVAAHSYQVSASIHPDPTVLVELSKAYAAAHRPRPAISALERAVNLSPGDPTAHTQLGLDLAQVGDLANARRQLAEAVQLDAKNRDAQLALSKIARAQGSDQPAVQERQPSVDSGVDDAESHLRAAEVALSQGRGEAENELRETLAIDPSLGAAHLRLGLLLLKSGATTADDELQAALLDPQMDHEDRARALAGLALIRYRSGLVMEAREFLEQAQGQRPTAGSTACIDYGLALTRRGASNWRGAKQAFDAAVQEDPGNSTFHVGALAGELQLYGETLTAQREGRLAEADRNLLMLIGMEPANPEYHLLRGSLLLSEEEPHDGLMELKMATSLDPSNPEGWAGQAEAMLALGDSQGSLAAIRRALLLAPLWTTIRPDIDVLLGRIELSAGKPQDGLLCLQYAVARHSPLVDEGQCDALIAKASEQIQQMDRQAAIHAQEMAEQSSNSPAVPENESMLIVHDQHRQIVRALQSSTARTVDGARSRVVPPRPTLVPRNSNDNLSPLHPTDGPYPDRLHRATTPGAKFDPSNPTPSKQAPQNQAPARAAPENPSRPAPERSSTPSE